MSQAIRVLLVDDHPVVREGLGAMLGRRPAVAVVGQAADGAQAVEMARRLKPDVVLMDLRMPVMDGVAATERICRDLPGVRVLVLTTFDQDDLILAGLRAGAKGYVLKDVPADDIVRAIEAVHRGEAYLHPAIAARVVERVAASAAEQGHDGGSRPDGLQQRGGRGDAPQPATPSTETTLSERESDVLAWLAKGLSNREIGDRLAIAESTVKTHLAGIYAKLGVSDRAGAVAEAARRGWLVLR